jgi:hypothetical protein
LRRIEYSLFPPLGLTQIAAYFGRYRPRGEKREEAQPMETKLPTPIRIALPVAASEEITGVDPLPALPLAGGGLGRGSALSRSHTGNAANKGDMPRFIPLAVAIDRGMTPPIGAIRTTPVDVAPQETSEPTRPSEPMRRHLRLLPAPGA